MTKSRLVFIAFILLLVSTVFYQRTSTVEARAPGAVEIFYSPETDLQQIDIALIGQAERTIDMAAYILSSWPIQTALMRAADRGVAVRLILDGSELARDRSRAFTTLKGRTGVSIKVKSGTELLHLKSFCIDGQTLRDGSANLTISGLMKQDNSLIVINSTVAAAAFERKFEALFEAGITLDTAAARGQPNGWIP